MPPEYIDFRLTVEGDPVQGYAVTAHGPGDTYARAQVPHALDAVQAVLARIEAGEAPTSGEMQEVGKRLYDLLFPAEIARLFQQTYAAQPAGTHLRLKLHLRTPALARLPWELAYDGQRFLAARLTHPIVRYVESQTPLKLLPLDLPLRILYVQASPRDRDQLDLDTSEAVLREAVQGWAEVTVVRGAKPADLLKALHQGEGYHILHFDGHGGFDTHRQQGFLVFEDEDGQARMLDGALLADYLAGTQVRLVVLAACHSGKASATQRFVGAAEQLMHDEALPAVVAMQFGVEDASAIAFNRGFYEALAGGYAVEGAVIAGRRAVLDHMGGYEQGELAGADWAAPTLFMRVGEGRLFPPSIARSRARDDTMRVLIEGVARLPTDYSTRIKNFLVEYLGIGEERVPFGGRDKELAELDAWLADPAAPPYTLIAAEAGRGKSSLLVRWAQRLTEQGEVAVIFIPVSLRFETAAASVAFTALAAALGEVYEEPVAWANLEPNQWKGICQSYLSRTPPDGKRVVVILDGLDEALDWQASAGLFPRQVVTGVRVVVSARYQAGDTDARGWLRRLGWDSARLARSMTLGQLDREGLRRVLAAMGNPLDHLVTRVDLLSELYRLTEGDPLLVRLYVLALHDRGEHLTSLRPEDLQAMQSGLAGYFDRWWADQRQLWGEKAPLREAGVRALLNLLAGALGPLDRETLLELAPPESGLDRWTLEEATLPLGRFVVGDGQGQGYVFSHPKLSHYFWEQLPIREQTVWEERFVAFGRGVLSDLNQGILTPRKASAYALQYYGTHLERAGAPAEDFFALVSEGWMRAWEALEGTYAGFLNDVAQAWDAADRLGRTKNERKAALPIQVRCALVFASITALSANLSASFLEQALRLGVLTSTQVLVITRQIPNESTRATALMHLAASHLPASLLPEALAAVQALQEERARASALASLALYLPASLLPEALATARALQEAGQQASVLANLALYLPASQQAEVLQEALVAARAVQEERSRASILESLAPHLPASQQAEVLQEALVAARAVQEAGQQASVLASLAPYLPASQQAEVLQEALVAARTLQDAEYRARLLEHLAPHLPTNLLPEALADARALQDEWLRASVLTRLTSYLPASQQAEVLQEALVAARAIEYAGYRVSALARLAPYLPASQQAEVLPEALAAARVIQDESSRASALERLAPYLPASLHQEALAIARAIHAESSRASALENLAPHLSASLLQEALVAARTIQHEEWRASLLARLASHLPASQQAEVLQEALAAARVIQHAGSRASVLVRLAPYLPASQQAEVLSEALAAARAIQDEWSRASALAQLMPHLAASQQAEVLPEALAAARAIQGEGWQASALRNLASHLPASQKAEVLQEALAAAQTLQSEGGRTSVLKDLAPRLPTSLLPEALAVARAIQDEEWRASLLERLAPHLPASLLQEALAAAQTLQGEGWRAGVLVSLAPYLPESQQVWVLQEALVAARTIQDEEWRASLLKRLASHVTASQQAEVLQEALAIARAMQDEGLRASVLERLAPHMSETLLAEALAITRAMQGEGFRAGVLVSLAPYLPESLFPEVLAITRAIQHEGWRASVLGSLALYLPASQQAEVLQEALAAARALQDEWSRASVLESLSSHLPAIQQAEVLQEALAAARALQDEGQRASVLESLSSHLPASLLPEALAAARALQNEWSRSRVLMSFASHLPARQQAEVLQEALATARAIQQEWSRASALENLAPHLPATLLAEALAAVCILRDKSLRISALGSLTPQLSLWAEQHPDEAYQAWCKTLRDLASHPRPDFLDDLSILLPFALALIDQPTSDVATQLFHAIQEVCEWWP